MNALNRAVEAMFDFLDIRSKTYRPLIEPQVMTGALLSALIATVRDEEAMELIVKTVMAQVRGTRADLAEAP